MALGGVIVAGACGRKKASGYDGYALVATSGERSLAVVDLTAFKHSNRFISARLLRRS